MRAALPALALLTAGCDLSMRDQPRDVPQRSAELWPGGPSLQPPPEGTVAIDSAARETALLRPPPLTPALLDRGEERYAIYCTPCHGPAGHGDGMIVRRGFPRPPAFGIARLRAAPASHMVDVITHGHGIMYAYADRIEPADRWAVAAYVKALQRADDLRR